MEGEDLHNLHSIKLSSYSSLLLGLVLSLVSYRCEFWEPEPVPQTLNLSHSF